MNGPCLWDFRAFADARLGFLAVTAAAAAFGCGSEVDNATGGERFEPMSHGIVIGTRDISPVQEDGGNVPSKFHGLFDAIGVLEPSGCTATHVGAGFVLTAGHCVGSVGDHCEELKVRWGMRGARPGMESTCTRVIATEWNRDRDIAVFEVDSPPLASVPMDLCREPERGTRVIIFGHPRNFPLVWARSCQVEPASFSGRGWDMFSHACDTEPGMSGAALVDETNLRIVGIHGGGQGLWNFATFLTAAGGTLLAGLAQSHE